MDNLESVVAESLLEKLGNLFFKGIDHLFDIAAKYEDEDGDLSAAYNIPVTDKDSNNHVVKLKLWPINGQKDVYVVNLECKDIEGFKPGEFSKKAIKLTKESISDFNKAVDAILEKNGLTRSQEAVSTGSSESQKVEKEEISIFIHRGNDSEEEECTAIVTISDSENGKKNISIEIDPEGTKNSFGSEFEGNEGISSDVNKFLDNWAERNGVTFESDEDIDSSYKINATLRKITSSDESYAKLDAINATCDIIHASEVLENILDDTEFFDSLNEDPQSFSFTKESGSPEIIIENIEEVDTTPSIQDLFNKSCLILNELRYLKWKTSMLDTSVSNVLESLCFDIYNCVNTFGKMLVQRGVKPSMFIEDTDCIIQESETVAEIKSMCETLCTYLDMYYQNFDHSIQSMIDSMILNLKEISNSL